MSTLEEIVITIFSALAEPFGSNLYFGLFLMLGLGVLLFRRGIVDFLVGEIALIFILSYANILPMWLSIVTVLILAFIIAKFISGRWGS